MTVIRDIGVDVIAPTGEWDGDDNCPFYGSLRVRGQIIEGSVSTTGMAGSIVVEREITRYMKNMRGMRREQEGTQPTSHHVLEESR